MRSDSAVKILAAQLYFAFAGLVFALGENTPVLPALRKLLPQLSFITYPVKYVSVVIFAAPLLAAFALAGFQKIQKCLLPLGAVLMALLAGILFWTQLAPMPGDDPPATLRNGISRAAFLILTGLVLFVLRGKTTSPLLRLAAPCLILIAWLDVLTHEPAQNPTVPPWVFQPGLSREKLALQPQPALGDARAMVSPMAANEFLTFAASDAKNNFLTKRLGGCANCNVLDAVPKVDGFFSLTPRESDEVLSLFYATTNASHPGLEAFMGVAQFTAPDAVFHWQSRNNFLPLVTAGQNPVFLDDAQALAALTQNDFDGGKTVFLPPAAKLSVTVSNQTLAKILNSKFSAQSVDADVDATEPSLVVVAQSYYHDWRVEIDGRPAPVLRANVAFQAVQVPAGKHRLHFFYQDRAFQVGTTISELAWLGGLAAFIILRRTRQV